MLKLKATLLICTISSVKYVILHLEEYLDRSCNKQKIKSSDVVIAFIVIIMCAKNTFSNYVGRYFEWGETLLRKLFFNIMRIPLDSLTYNAKKYLLWDYLSKIHTNFKTKIFKKIINYNNFTKEC